MKQTLETFLEDAFQYSNPELTERQQFLLKNSQKKITVEIPIEMEDGSLMVFMAYRVQHNNSRGPFKGGLRFSPTVSLEHFETLASLMTWKTALAGVPFGGAKGGINCDPHRMSERELRQLVTAFCDRMYQDISPEIDIPAPDLGTSEREMGWILQDFSRFKGYSPEVVTGKPFALGGLPGRTEATGFGTHLAALWAAESRGLNAAELDVAIQGFGNVGKHAATFLHEAGSRVVAISDSSQCLYSTKGLDIPKVNRVMKKNNTTRLSEIDCTGLGESCHRDKLFEIKANLFIPAAVEHAINESTMKKLSATIIVEAANMPTTLVADRYLRDQGVMVIPDIFANSGGVIASFFEWAQNHQREQWKKETTLLRLKNHMAEVWDKICETNHQNQNLRATCYAISIDRVFRATKARGL